MIRDVDGLTSATLKHLRDRWWDDAFTDFVRDTLQPRPGRRILDVGCGHGTAEVKLSRGRLTQVDLVAVDLIVERVTEAHAAARAHNIDAHFAAADACRLPFADATFDSVFCVAVLQHIGDVRRAVGEMARVTRPGGRIVAVEPDNAARYFYRSVDDGRRAHEAARRFFSALAEAKGDSSEPAVGPQLPTLFSQTGIEPLSVRMFPVSMTMLGSPPAEIWAGRKADIEQAIASVSADAVRAYGQKYLEALDEYAAEAAAAGPGFVEIQNTMLFATVGQKSA